MKRFAFAAAAALLGTGCVSSTTTPFTPTGSVDIGWSFLRYKVTGPSWVTYTCAQAGIDNVVVWFSLGGSVHVPCADNVGDGAFITGVAVGTQNVIVTGRRGLDELYASDPVAVTVAENQTTQISTVQALGIPGNIAVYANFLGQFGQNMNWVTCSDAGITSLFYDIEDYANTVIATATVSCTDPAGVSFVGADALDLDNYVIRMKGYSGGPQTFDSATMALTPVCDGQAFDHLANGDVWDVAVYDITHNATPPTNYGFCL